MKFYFVTSNDTAPWGGSEVLWSEVALQLLRAGNQVGVSAPYWKNPPQHYRELAEKGAKFFHYRSHLTGLIPRILHRLSGKGQRYEAISKFKPDLVVISQGGSFDGLGWSEWCVREKIPFALICQAVRDINWPNDQTCERIIGAFPMAERLYFVSNQNRSLFEKQVAFEFPNAAIAKNAGLISLDSTIASWPTDKLIRLAIVARLEPVDKGQDLVIELFTQKKWRDRKIEVSCFGAGPQLQTLQRLVKMRGLENKIKFYGFKNDIKEIWRQHHALLMPSRSEGQSLAVIEAMLVGRPVITTNVGDNSILIEEGKTGFLMDHANVDQLDQSLESAWRVHADWQKIGENARTKVRNYLAAPPVITLANDLVSLAEGNVPNKKAA